MRTLALFTFFALAACATPAVGTKCNAGDTYCATPKTARLCGKDGVLFDLNCGGPKGCAETGSVWNPRPITCDQGAGVAAGTFCSPEYEGKSQCTADGVAKLTCNSGVWASVACAQGQACGLGATGVACR